MDLPVSEDRLRADIEATAEFGAIDAPEGHGRTVLTGTDANGNAREYFADRLDEAGLDVRVDRVGNVAGRWTPDDVDPEAAPVAAGSHLDSVIEGGIFDGPLGVYAALEAVRAMQEAEADATPERPVEVVCFTEEEGGRFSEGLLGSSIAAGVRPIEEALTLTDSDGVTLESVLDGISYLGEGRLDASDWDAWLELHIEQGTRLESMGKEVGVVTTVTGITHCDATITGETDHAGSTPMATRTDALTAASELTLDIERAGRRAAGVGVEAPNEEASVSMDGGGDAGDGNDGGGGGGDSDSEGTTVATVGKIDARPNATNVVPGEVELGIDIRDVEREPIDRIVDGVRGKLSRLETERGVETTLTRPLDVSPTPMAGRCRETLNRAAERTEIEATELHSGAAHDTMHVARVADTGMCFAPSQGGFSHSPREWTDWADCAAATRVFASALAELAGYNRSV
jgi:N-carbamoyl-L-amino-acid hydrolase